MTCRTWQRYIEGFRKWLEVLNYVEASHYYDPIRLREFLDWMTENGVEGIDQITGSKVKDFFSALSERKSKRTGDYLSSWGQRNYLTTLKRFARYLQNVEGLNIEISVEIKGRRKKPIVVLAETEITQLYEATDDSLLGMRDRALLAVFYGCGVRRNEASHIKVHDILPDRNLLYIRKGKGYKERYVPIVGRVKKDLINYLTIARPMLKNRVIDDVFFVGITGKPLKPEGMYERIKKLVKKSGIKKEVGLHTLRHSIATHLLINGMKLSEIAKFLGHSTLESTQIYTHLKYAED